MANGQESDALTAQPPCPILIIIRQMSWKYVCHNSDVLGCINCKFEECDVSVSFFLFFFFIF